MAKQIYAFRLSEEELRKLFYLRRFSGQTGTELLSWAINSLYDLARDIEEEFPDSKEIHHFLFDAIRLTSFHSEVNKAKAREFFKLMLGNPRQYENLMSKRRRELEKEMIKDLYRRIRKQAPDFPGDRITKLPEYP